MILENPMAINGLQVDAQDDAHSEYLSLAMTRTQLFSGIRLFRDQDCPYWRNQAEVNLS